MAERPRRYERDAARLDQPREARQSLIHRPSMDPDAFGKFAETFARFMGTARFLGYMTVFVILWIAFNLVGLLGLKWDPYPFILLNLFFSTQASYAAPLILLAQNRQDDRDRVTIEQDRARDERNLADTEYLTREVAALRIALRDMATRDYLRSELRSLLDDMDERFDLRGSAHAEGAAPVDADAAQVDLAGSGSDRDRPPEARRSRRTT